MKMNLSKNQIILGVVIIVGIVWIVAFYKPSKVAETMNNQSSSTSTVVNTNTNTTSNTTSKPKVVTSTSVSNQILIYKLSFNPTALNLKKGATVTWVNKDNSIHRIIADNLGPTSNDLLPGQSYSFKFTAAGVFGYHDYYNATTTGTIIVK
jgi:plastocyanin